MTNVAKACRRNDLQQHVLFSASARSIILVLIGSVVFGALSVSEAVGQDGGVLVELTNDRIVDVPYANRGDEIGDIAKATEVFKQSIAQKVINLRVRAALDVVRRT